MKVCLKVRPVAPHTHFEASANSPEENLPSGWPNAAPDVTVWGVSPATGTHVTLSPTLMVMEC